MSSRDRQRVRSGPPPEPPAHRGPAPVSPYRAPAVQRGQPQPTRLNRAAVAHLQQAAGNQAISSLLGHRRAISTVVQRAIENESFKDGISAVDKANTKGFFAAFDAAVQTAHKYVLSVPSLGAWANLNGYTRLWGEKWADFLSGGRPKLMAATFGYVIESLVSEDTDFRPGPPSGCTVIPQVTSGGTRPDLVLRLKKGGTDIAWLDLTASASVDHIYDKEGWDAKVGTFAEVTYPSLDPGDLALMVQNKDNTGTLTKEQFEIRRAAAQAAYMERKRHWMAMGREKYSVGKHKRVLDRIGRMNIQLNPSRKQTVIKAALERDFGTEVDNKMIPSILQAMWVSPGTWGFDTGYSQSERAGEAWLVDNDTTLPSPEPEEPTGVGAEDTRPPAGGRRKEKKKVRAGDPY